MKECSSEMHQFEVADPVQGKLDNSKKKILTEHKNMRCATKQCQRLQSNPKGYKLHSQELGWKESQQRNDLQFKMEILR